VGRQITRDDKANSELVHHTSAGGAYGQLSAWRACTRRPRRPRGRTSIPARFHV